MSPDNTTDPTPLTDAEHADHRMACLLLGAEARSVVRTWSRIREHFARQLPSKLAAFGIQQTNIAIGAIDACEGAADDQALDPSMARRLIQQVASRNPLWTPTSYTPATTPAPASESESAPTHTQESP
jgi:hypothetical protein